MTTDPESIEQAARERGEQFADKKRNSYNGFDRGDYIQVGYEAGYIDGVSAGIQAERERIEASIADHNRMMQGYHAELDRQNAAGARKTDGKIA